MKEPIFCDNHLLVAQKPPGLSTQPYFHDQVRSWIEQRFNKKGKAFVEPIHRLDRPVGGLVLFARTTKALVRLNEAMRQRKIHKTYLAKVEGTLPQKKGVMRNQIVHGSFCAQIVEKEGKEAILEYEQQENGLVKIKLITGRYHQIRAQFAHANCPIVGDTKYGSQTRKAMICLVHHSIICPHPIGGDPITFTSSFEGFSI